MEQRQGSAIEADWFELTNVGTTKVDLTGWRMNDNHASFASSVPLEGVTSLAPGHSAVFVNGDETATPASAKRTSPNSSPTGSRAARPPASRSVGCPKSA